MLRPCLAIAIVTVSAYAQTSDVIAPALLSFSFSPSSVDTRSGPRNIAFTANISDDLSGISNAEVLLNGPRGQSQLVPLTITAGTRLLGTYTAS
ncbi:MAG TPA: hypothetical protein VEX68_13340 [Bryobacteraceae bacterium]|nr:hypothetical protein [Bryobacteraceae bacterium]